MTVRLLTWGIAQETGPGAAAAISVAKGRGTSGANNVSAGHMPVFASEVRRVSMYTDIAKGKTIASNSAGRASDLGRLGTDVSQQGMAMTFDEMRVDFIVRRKGSLALPITDLIVYSTAALLSLAVAAPFHNLVLASCFWAIMRHRKERQ